MSNYSPWGKIDNVTKVCRGIAWVGTPSHGGVRVSEGMAAKMPDYMRNIGEHSHGYWWFEEDSAWVVPAIVFNELSPFKVELDEMKRTLRNSFPEAYERHYETVLTEGESVVRDEQLFLERHKNDYVTVCAFGDWAWDVPSGMVYVIATLGGVRGREEKGFLVPQNEYQTRNRNGFVIDETHQAWEPDKSLPYSKERVK